MTSSHYQYAAFLTTRCELAKLLEEGKSAFAKVDMQTWVATSDELLQRLNSERFKVIVLGEFKRGKSTFVNALLGREVLPAFATPCTAIINELKWSDEPRSMLHFKNPLPLQIPEGVPDEVMRHLEKHRGSPAPPLPIAVEDLERYVVIPDPTKDQSVSIRETPYEFAEIFWPLDLLRNSVEIIDSPGLNEHGSRTKVTMEYLSRVDAVVFLFSVHALASQTEIAVIDHDLRTAGHEYLFFVCNRIDEIRKPVERDRVTQYAYDQLAGRTAFGREGIFFVSALDAVDGRERNLPELVTRSGIPQLEKSLADFLVKDRGRIKLLQPSRQLAQGVKQALFETIPEKRRMLAADLAQLQQRYNEALPKLKEADRRRNTVVAGLERCRIRMRDAVRDSAINHLRQVADQVPLWAAKVKVEKSVSVFKVWAIEKQVEAVAQEVVAAVAPFVEAATQQWQSQQLKPLVQHHLSDFDAEAQAAVSEFMVDIEEIRSQLSGVARGNILPEARLSAVERVLSTAGGLFLGGPGMALEGATMGYQAMLRSLIPNILVVTAIFFLQWNPITIVPALLALGVFRAFRQGDAISEKVKVQVGVELAKQIVANIPSQASKIADETFRQTEGLVTAVSVGLDREIATIRQQVEAVLAVKRAGSQQVAADESRLRNAERELQSVDSRLSEFILRLVQPT
jgi:GTPase SAR1 family protein